MTKLGHTAGEWITDKEANCTEDGSKHQVCSVCDATIKTSSIAKFGHLYGNWITDITATCVREGSKHQECTRCADIVTVSIDMLRHTHSFLFADTSSNLFYLHCNECRGSVCKEITAVEATLNSKSMGANGIQWTVNAEGGTGVYSYSFSVLNCTLGIWEYISSPQTSNIITFPISNSSSSNLMANDRTGYIRIYDSYSSVEYSFKIDASFPWEIELTLVDSYN